MKPNKSRCLLGQMANLSVFSSVVPQEDGSHSAPTIINGTDSLLKERKAQNSKS